jgi:hypothetical protein
LYVPHITRRDNELAGWNAERGGRAGIRAGNGMVDSYPRISGGGRHITTVKYWKFIADLIQKGMPKP